MAHFSKKMARKTLAEKHEYYKLELVLAGDLLFLSQHLPKQCQGWLCCTEHVSSSHYEILLPWKEAGGTRRKKRNKQNSDDVYVSCFLPSWAIPACSATLTSTGSGRKQLRVRHGLQLISWQLEEKATGKY